MRSRAKKMVAQPNVSVVITGHREGSLAGPSIRSALAAIDEADHEMKLSAEIIVVLDRASGLTKEVFRSALEGRAVFLETELGDPGQARNAAVEIARGEAITFLDGDDLWSKNWLVEGWNHVVARPDAVGHCACIVTFGEGHGLWWHIDSEGPLFREDYLLWSNYWDAMSFASTEIYRKYPFTPNDLQLGFGHEDWHWNCLTISQGVPHKPVPRTLHFKRRRSGSQMTLVEKSDATVWPLHLK